MHAKQDTQLLESLGSELPGRKRDSILLQILNNPTDSLHVFGEFGIIRLVPLLNLVFANQPST